MDCLGTRRRSRRASRRRSRRAPRLERYDGPERFDILPLLVCTDGAVSMFGRDARRLRPNLLIEGVPGTDERWWEGVTLRLPRVEIAVTDLRATATRVSWGEDE